MNKLLAILVATLPATANAAIWDDHQALICRGDRAATCDVEAATCDKRDSSAVWKVNFNTKSVTYLGGQYREAIVARNSYVLDGSPIDDTIMLASNRILKFFKPKSNAFTGIEIKAVLVGSSLSESLDGMTFTCGPDF